MIKASYKKVESLAPWIALMLTICILALAAFPNGNMRLPDFSSALGAVIRTQEAADSVSGGIRGIDVSVYQGDINWARVSNDNVQFAIVRATYGLETDKKFYDNIHGASDNGLLVGAYHYAKWTDRASMREEAQYFLDTLSGVKEKITYPVVLDLENNRGGLTRKELTDCAKEFIDIVKAQGYQVLLYSYDNYFRDYLLAGELAGYDLWVANYVEEPGRNQKIWQHTSVGQIDGIAGPALIDIAYANLATGRKVGVSKSVSDSIKVTLNERYDAGLALEGLDMAGMKRTVVTAMQSELNRQLDAGLNITGEMDAYTLDALETVAFTHGETSGRMTYLLQVMLFYRGHYTEQLSGAYDDHMLQAIQKFQRECDIETNGQLDRATIWYLLR